MQYPTLESLIGNTPLVRLQRIGADTGNTLLVKLEGQNPAGSVKDRPAYSMIRHAQARGEIRPGDTLIEATSGNTGIALAMVAAMLGYRMILIMPETMSMERRASMAAYGAELILVSEAAGMEGARDLAERMQAEGKGKVIASPRLVTANNVKAHIEQGQERVFTVTVLGAGSVVTKKAVLGLTVTPQITPDERIILDVSVTKDRFASADSPTGHRAACRMIWNLPCGKLPTGADLNSLPPRPTTKLTPRWPTALDLISVA